MPVALFRLGATGIPYFTKERISHPQFFYRVYFGSANAIVLNIHNLHEIRQTASSYRPQPMQTEGFG